MIYFSTMKGLMKWWMHHLETHRGMVLVALSVLTIASVYGVTKLDYSNAITDLLPVQNREVSRYLHVIQEFGVSEDIVVAVTAPKGHDQELQLYLDLYLETLRSDARWSKLLKGADYNLSQKLDLLFTPFFLEHVSLLIPSEELTRFVHRFQPDEMQHVIRNCREMLETGTGSSMLIEKDPLGLLGFMASLSGQVKGKYELDFPDGYYMSKDHTLLLGFLKPTRPAGDMTYTREVMTFLLEARDKAMAAYWEETESDVPLQVRFTGAHAITYFDREVMQNDMGSTFLFSFLLVLLVFVLAYRNPLSFLYAAVPLMLGELWAFGLTYFLLGGLNLLTSVTAAIIVGLGIDFSIHVYSRYLDTFCASGDPGTSVRTAMVETGASTLAGGLTTAAAFGAMTLSSFKGLREFGIVASLGILCTLLAVFSVVPLMATARKYPRRPREMARFGLHFFHGVLDRHPKPVFWLLTLVTVAMLIAAVRLEFHTDMRQLRSKTNPALQLQTEITGKLKASVRSLSLILKAENQQELEARYLALQKKLATMDVARVESLFSVVPPMSIQQKNIHYLKSVKIPGDVVKRFHAEFDAAGMVCDDYCNRYIRLLNRSLHVSEPLEISDVMRSSMAPLFDRMVKQNGDGLELIVRVYPRAATWDHEAMARFMGTIDGFLAQEGWDGSYLTGIERVVGEIKYLIRENFYLSTVLSLLLVFLLVYLHQRQVRLVLLSFVPLVAGIIWMLGVLQLSGDNITLYNFMATPMIIGIGIDQGIHLLDRYLASGRRDISDTVIHTGKAITFTALTTVIGFGSLFLSHFEGFVHLGFTTILGVVFCWFSALVYFPSLLLIGGDRLLGQPGGKDGSQR